MPDHARKMTATIFPVAREGPSPPVRKIPERSGGEPAAWQSRLQAKISRANWKMPASTQAAIRLRAESRKRIAPGGEKPEAAQGSLCRAFVSLDAAGPNPNCSRAERPAGPLTNSRKAFAFALLPAHLSKIAPCSIAGYRSAGTSQRLPFSIAPEAASDFAR